MRTPLATLTLTLALSLAGLASADVYKCPAPGGKTIYQDAPCSGEAAPLVESTPTPQLSVGEAHCQGLATAAYTIAAARNRGASLAALLAVARTSFDDPALPPAAAQLMRETLGALVMHLYERPWLGPLAAKTMAETMCVKALQRTDTPTPKLLLQQY